MNELKKSSSNSYITTIAILFILILGFFLGSCTGLTSSGNTALLTITNVIVDPDSLGNLEVSDFPLTIDGIPVLSGITQQLSVGTYKVGAKSDPNYKTEIMGDCASDGTITLTQGTFANCTVTHTYAIPGLQNPPTLNLSNMTIMKLASTASPQTIGLLYTTNTEQNGQQIGQFELIAGVADNALFSLRNDKLQLKQSSDKDSYTISIRWKVASGVSTKKDFLLNSVNPNQIVPSQRFGNLAYIGQDGADFRALTPERSVLFTGYERYYFSQHGYTVDVCLSTDSVIAITVSKSHTRSGDFSTAESFGFTETIEQLEELYGAANKSLAFADYRAYVYNRSSMNNINGGDVTFGYFGSEPEGATDISISQRYCPL